MYKTPRYFGYRPLIALDKEPLMPLHPQAKAFLEIMSAAGLPDVSIQGARVARENSHREPDLSGPIEEGVTVHHRYFTSPTADLPLRIYVPDAVTGPFNGLVYLHGGGWVHGNIARYEAQLVSLAKKTNSVVVSVNYQKAPEHKFPIPFDDCYAALEWVFANTEAWDIDPRKIGIGGDSAGANLASGVALKARDVDGPPIAYQLLIYPCNGLDFNSESMLANQTGFGLSREDMMWFADQYLNGVIDRSNPYAFPHSALNLADLPPTILITAEFDVLQDDGRLYAQKLQDAGVEVAYQNFQGMIHGFFSCGKYIDEGIRVRDYFTAQIKNILGS
jgi:acetyl esterase